MPRASPGEEDAEADEDTKPEQEQTPGGGADARRGVGGRGGRFLERARELGGRAEPVASEGRERSPGRPLDAR